MALLEKKHAGNDGILEVVTSVSVCESIELKLLRDLEVSTVEGEFCSHRPDAIERIHEELELGRPILGELCYLPDAVGKDFVEEVAGLSLTEHAVVDAKPNLFRSDQKGDNS